ncbi:MAG: hypothetical protein ACRD5H_06000, partial [Nitrososphaerales archaeon]
SKKYAKYGDDDVRYETFYNFENVLIHYAILHKLSHAFEKGLVEEKTAQNLFGISVTDSHFPPTLLNMQKFEKVSFALLINFNTEVIVKVILRCLTQKNAPDQFYNTIGALLSHLSLSDADHKKRILYTMALIRNGLHSNGIHTKATVSPYLIKGHTFEFVKGKEIRCATWSHLCAAFERILEVLEEVVDSSKVSAFVEQMPWYYSPL